MIENSNSNQALYDVIHLMVSNANKALKTVRDDDNQRNADNKKAAAEWSEKFLNRLEDALENNRRVQVRLTADLSDGSWTVNMRQAAHVYAVDYRRGEFLFTTGGSEWYRVGLMDPSNPSVQRG